eukprot:6190214-Pleurochrysis_carterae.AAC.1
MQQLVRSDDTVLEIGCQLTESTRILSTLAARVEGVDILRELNGRSCQANTYRAHESGEAAGMPNVQMHMCTPWDLATIQAECGSADMVFVDVNHLVGSDLMLESLSLARQLLRIQPAARALVIKSRALYALQRQLVPASKLASVILRGKALAPASAALIVTTVGVTEYRSAALQLLLHLPRNRVLEIGCHTGTSTALLHAAASARGGGCIGVDVSSAIIARARAAHPHVLFDVCDGWDVRGLLRVAAHGEAAVWGDAVNSREGAAQPEHAGRDVPAVIKSGKDTMKARGADNAGGARGSGGAENARLLENMSNAEGSRETGIAGREADGFRFSSALAARTVDDAWSVDMVCVDVGGVSGAHGELDAVALLQLLSRAFGDSLRAVVVKSHCLRTASFALRAVPALDPTQAVDPEEQHEEARPER